MRILALMTLPIALLSSAIPPSAGTPVDRPHMLAALAAQQHRAQCPAPNTLNAARCHHDFPDGCATNATSHYDPDLAFLKNQTISPAEADAQLQRTFTRLSDFTTLDQATQSFGQNFGTGQTAGHAQALAQSKEGEIDAVIGYLYYADRTGAESCNCELTADADTDIHIGIGFDPVLAKKIKDGKVVVTTDPHGTDDAKRTSIVVEMTPHYRAQFHPHWTQPVIETLHGRQVKVVGQLLADADHNENKQDCAFPNKVLASCWRASIWELHPVTRLYVCEDGKTCSATSTSGWQEIP